jgi:aspartate racemase
MGVLGGMSAQATMDFEARVHRCAQRLVAQDWNRGYPPMVVWYHRELPVRRGADGQMLEPRQIDPQLVEAAARLAALVDFLVVPCNAAHVGLAELRAATGRPVLSMIDVVLDEVVARACRRVGVLGALAARRRRTSTDSGSAGSRVSRSTRRSSSASTPASRP